jgi:hypothetical protein
MRAPLPLSRVGEGEMPRWMNARGPFTGKALMCFAGYIRDA